MRMTRKRTVKPQRDRGTRCTKARKTPKSYVSREKKNGGRKIRERARFFGLKKKTKKKTKINFFVERYSK